MGSRSIPIIAVIAAFLFSSFAFAAAISVGNSIIVPVLATATPTPSPTPLAIVRANINITATLPTASPTPLSISKSIANATTSAAAISDLIYLQGPMAYALSGSAIKTIDTSTRAAISSIKVDVPGLSPTSIALSPDNKVLYVVVSGETSGYEEGVGYDYTAYIKLLRFNTTTQTLIDSYDFGKDIIPYRIDVAPDGRVYVSYSSNNYHQTPGIGIVDYSQGKRWELSFGDNEEFPINDVEFSADGSKVFVAAWSDPAKIYMLDWVPNKLYYKYLKTADDVFVSFPRTLAYSSVSGELYAAVDENYNITVYEPNSRTVQAFHTDYAPMALATSPDGSTLYSAGERQLSDGTWAYELHKYTGLKNAWGADYSFNDGTSFYTTDGMISISLQKGYEPGELRVTPDGKFGYLSTTDGYYGGQAQPGYAIEIYDLEYMNFVKEIPLAEADPEIAVASDMIIYKPAIDYSLLKDASIISSGMAGTLLSSVMYVKSATPKNGSVAKPNGDLGISVYADLSDDVDKATATQSSFSVYDSKGNPVAGKITVAGKLAIFTPATPFAEGANYSVKLSTALKSTDGKPLMSDYSWWFTAFDPHQAIFPIKATILPIQPLVSKTWAPVRIAMPYFPSATATPQLTQVGGQPGQVPAVTPISGGSSGVNPTASINPDSNFATPYPLDIEPDQVNDSNLDRPLIDNSTGTNHQAQPGGVNLPSNPNQAKELNPQPEPPAPKGFFDQIIDFFKGIFGMK